MPMFRRWKLILAMLACFLLGGACGIAWTAYLVESYMTRIMNRGPEELRRHVVGRISRQLDLNASQQKALEPIAARMNADLLALRNRVAPKIEQAIVHGAESLRPHLDASQQEKLDAILHNRRRVWLQLDHANGSQASDRN